MTYLADVPALDRVPLLPSEEERWLSTVPIVVSTSVLLRF